jgi:hypothetical protein
MSIESPPSRIYQIVASLGVSPVNVMVHADLARLLMNTFPATVSAIPPAVPPTFEELIQTSGSDGEEVIINTGVTYVYSAAATGWMRKTAWDLRDGDIGLLKEIVGDDASPAGWSVLGNASLISTVGGKVFIETVGAGDSETCRLGSSFTAASGQTIYTYGFLRNLGTEDVDAIGRGWWMIDNGVRLLIFNYTQDDGTKGRIVSFPGNSPIDTVVTPVNITTESVVEFIMIPGGTCSLWINNSPSASLTIPYTSLPASPSGNEECFIGDSSTSDTSNSDTSIRNLRIFRIT